jgi:hypothetical protein
LATSHKGWSRRPAITAEDCTHGAHHRRPIGAHDAYLAALDRDTLQGFIDFYRRLTR